MCTCITLDTLFYMSVGFLLVKSSGVICLLGAGLGFTLTMWIVYKVYLKSKTKTTRRPSSTDSTAYVWKNFDEVTMGNGGSISVGINVCDDEHGLGSKPGIRHRHTLTNKDNPHQVCASIVESDSGAYISRSAFGSAPQSHELWSVGQESRRQTPHMKHDLTIAFKNNNIINLDEPPLPTVMNDSGYLDMDGLATSDNVPSNILNFQTEFSVDKLEKHNRMYNGDKSLLPLTSTSVRSSLSDSAMHDLGSDFSARCSQANDLDEEILAIELCVDDITLSNMAVLENTLCSFPLADEDKNKNHIDNSIYKHGNNTITSEPQDLEIETDWNDFDELSSTYSPSIAWHLTQTMSPENSNASSNLSSPLFQTTSSHSRTSSVTSADIDMESGFIDDEIKSDIDRLELELTEIKQEICEIEEKVNYFMATDTSLLYFNVDSMKKITEVVLNSDDIVLSASEIAKAFQILRKYRYTFSSPERSKDVIHKEAEEPKKHGSSGKISLPYLDLAEPQSATQMLSQKTLSDWLYQSSKAAVNGNLDCTDKAGSIAHEYPISQLSKFQPILQQGYDLLTDEFGFKSMCLLKLDDSALLAAAYMGMIFHHKTTRFTSINVDSCLKQMRNLYTASHPYLETWTLPEIFDKSMSHVQILAHCLKTLIKQTQELHKITDPDERRCEILNLYNHAPYTRALIIEGIKLLLFLKICSLYEKYADGSDVPIYTWLLFARDSSQSPRSYFNNHIQMNFSRVPDQVDINLLADVFGIRLQTFRPTKAGRDDFMELSSIEDHQGTDLVVPLSVHSSTSYAVLY